MSFLEKSEFKVESLFHMRRTHAFMMGGLLARRCSVSPSTVLVSVSAIQMASNCWLPHLNVAIAHDCCTSWGMCVVVSFLKKQKQ